MRTLKITLIATAIATALSFWAGQLGLMHRLWPDHPQFAGFILSLVACIAVQLFWPKEWLEGQRKKS
ncbi:MAG TPA: hypothetical protein VEF05_10750 [Terriglobales bacterium]|nr:hypothetical protein [Terriglobales bacterium]